jgi:hypothetical protein
MGTARRLPLTAGEAGNDLAGLQDNGFDLGCCDRVDICVSNIV